MLGAPNSVTYNAIISTLLKKKQASLPENVQRGFSNLYYLIKITDVFFFMNVLKINLWLLIILVYIVIKQKL